MVHYPYYRLALTYLYPDHPIHIRINSCRFDKRVSLQPVFQLMQVNAFHIAANQLVFVYFQDIINLFLINKILVAGYGAQVQVYSERISPSIYFNATQTPLAKERFYRDMRQHEPDMILVPLFPEYRQYIGADLQQYIDQLVAKDYYLDRCMFNYNVYRLKKTPSN